MWAPTSHHFVHLQIQIKNLQYTIGGAAPKPPVQKTVKPKFSDMVKGGFKDNEVCICADDAPICEKYDFFLLSSAVFNCSLFFIAHIVDWPA